MWPSALYPQPQYILGSMPARPLARWLQFLSAPNPLFSFSRTLYGSEEHFRTIFSYFLLTFVRRSPIWYTSAVTQWGNTHNTCRRLRFSRFGGAADGSHCSRPPGVCIVFQWLPLYCTHQVMSTVNRGAETMDLACVAGPAGATLCSYIPQGKTNTQNITKQTDKNALKKASC